MTNITKEKIEKAISEEIPKWREKKTKWGRIKEFVSNHKILTIALVALSGCIIANIILIYNFFRILATL